VFFINVPIGAAALALTPRIVPESRSDTAAQGGYDVAGALAITLGTLALVFTLIKADAWGWGSGKTIAGFVVAVALTGSFVAIERRARNPLVPLRIFSNRSLAASDATMLLVAAALFGMFFFCTLYLQQVLGFSPLKTGVSYLPFSLTLVVASANVSRLVDRFTPKPVLVSGLLITTAGFIVLTQASGHGDYWSHVFPAMVILGVGLGGSFVPITIAATTGVAPEDSGLASGLLNTTQQVGGALGLAVLSTVSTTRVTNALHVGAPLPVALTHGFKGGFIVAAIICAAGAMLALATLPGHKRSLENKQAEAVSISCESCPGAPACGHLARLAAVSRRMRATAAARS
jgi:predicted MFS family arabinose efflux permease